MIWMKVPQPQAEMARSRKEQSTEKNEEAQGKNKA